MSYTAGQVIKAALQRILVQASEADLEPDEYADAMLALNTMMSSWESQGIDLGYTQVDNVSDPITVSPGAIRGIIANLAIETSPDYNGKISQGLVAQAAEGLKAIRLLAIKHIPTQWPDNLPIGTGYDDAEQFDHFFDSAPIDVYSYQIKAPLSVRPYSIDWTDRMEMDSDTISTSSWTTTAPLAVDSDSNTTLTTTAVVSGGEVGGYYNLVNTVTTTGGSTYVRTIVIKVQEI